MDGAVWTPDDDPIVGVVDQPIDPATAHASAHTDALDETLTAHDAEAVSGAVEDVLAAEPSIVVALGDAALSTVVPTGVATPVLPVDVGQGIDSIPRGSLHRAIEAALGGAGRIRRRPVLCVDVDDGPRARALFDVTLVTDEPARISEYSLRSRGESIAQFRADGVVVGTPAGSHGYTSAAGGPLVASAVEAVSVVPIAPFETRTRQWILPDDDLSLAVERDEDVVAVRADDRTVDTITAGSSVSIAASESVSILVVPDG